jgi:hypothetical protein
MSQNLFRDWKLAAFTVGGFCLFVGAFFSDGGGYEELGQKAEEIRDTRAPDTAPIALTPVAAAPAPATVVLPEPEPEEPEFNPDEPVQQEGAFQGEATAAPTGAATPATSTEAPL